MSTERLSQVQFIGLLAWFLGFAVLAAAGVLRAWCDPADAPNAADDLADAHGDVPTIAREQAALMQAATWGNGA